MTGFVWDYRQVLEHGDCWHGILLQIGQHLHYGVLQKSEFKIVYVAPMKVYVKLYLSIKSRFNCMSWYNISRQALAGEMTAAFSHRLGPLNVVVRELTGDMQLTKRELEETQVLGIYIADRIVFFVGHFLTMMFCILDDCDNSWKMGCHYTKN